jgi:hypothetical protein
MDEGIARYFGIVCDRLSNKAVIRQLAAGGTMEETGDRRNVFQCFARMKTGERPVCPQFSDCVKGAQALLQYARIRAIK